MTELKEFIEEVINQIKVADRKTGAKIYDAEVTIDVAITTGNITEQAGEYLN